MVKFVDSLDIIREAVCVMIALFEGGNKIAQA